MAKPDHVEIVKQGSDATVAWQKAHKRERFDLSKADLREVNLRKAFLSEADLSKADLREANLSGAILRRANLSGAILHRANLSGAILLGTNLSETNLSETNLNGANFFLANLSGATLRLDSFSRAKFHKANLSQIHLSGIGPFTDAPTLIRSIEFPSAYCQAAVGILGYFREVLRHKAPDIQTTVRIEQEDRTVRLVILTDEGHRETVEQTLDTYGLVVTGRMPPEALLSDPLQLMALKHRLEMSQMEVRFAQEQLRLKDQWGQQLQSRVDSLEEDVNWFKQHLGESLRTEHHVQTQLVTGYIQALTALVTELTARQDELQLAREQQRQLTEALQTLRGELRAPQPNHTTLQQAVATVRNVLEGAAGSILASEVLLKLAVVGTALGLR